MNSPEVVLSPCVRLFIELLVDGVGERDSSEAPTISLTGECPPLEAVTAAMNAERGFFPEIVSLAFSQGLGFHPERVRTA
jgi:hypothetical protein